MSRSDVAWPRARGRVANVAATLRLVRAARQLLRATACVLLVWGAAAVLDTFVDLPLVVREWFLPCAGIAALLLLWRGRAAFGRIDPTRAALWVEEQDPSLQYALVTAIDDSGAVVLRVGDNDPHRGEENDATS